MINVIDLTCLSYHLSGIERYALCITKEMIKQDKENEYILVFRDCVYPDFEQNTDQNRVKTVVLKGKQKQFFQLIVLPWALYRIKADNYIFFANRSPLFFRKGKIYNTIHDLVCWDFPETTRWLQRMYSRIANRNAARVSEQIFTVSEFSKGRIHKLLKYPLARITVTYNGISDKLKNHNSNSFEDIKHKYGLPDKYIMNLSTLEPRKNLSLLLHSFDLVSEKVNYDLVLVGRKGWKIEKLLQTMKANERIHITGFIDDEEVSQIYQHALCFIFTSLYEGFGIPPIEALFFGTPVLSSDAACMTEILRNQALYFESNNAKELVEKLLVLETESIGMPRELDNYQKKNYSFEVSAKKILDVINS